MKLDENQKSDEEEMLIYAFNTYYEKVFGFFCGHLYDRTLSQDMAGEVFLRVAASWQKYDKTKGAISTWIFTIAQNVMKDYWKKKKLVQVELCEAQDSFDVSDFAESREEIEALKKAMDCLPERERQVLQFKYFAGLKNTEIAELTGISASNTGVLVHRALKKLKEKLKEYL